jgi:hypothetical protein
MAGSGNAITTFEPGNIYTIEDLEFSKKHIDTKPEEKRTELECLVTVTVMDWKENLVEWAD